MAIFPAHNLSKQVIDVYSRFVVGWDVFNTLDTKNSLSVLKKAIAKYGKPEIINSDQGCQFTSELWTSYLEKEVKDIKISMDSRGRTTDNAYIERLWRTVKRDYVYIYSAEDGVELYNGLKKFFIYYNTKKRHQGIGREIPCKRYKKAA